MVLSLTCRGICSCIVVKKLKTPLFVPHDKYQTHHDRPGVRQAPEGSGEQGKMEKTGCKIICGALTTLVVKGLMMMMMMMINQGYTVSFWTVSAQHRHRCALTEALHVIRCVRNLYWCRLLFLSLMIHPVSVQLTNNAYVGKDNWLFQFLLNRQDAGE